MNINQLGTMALALVIAAIVIGVGSTFQTTLATDTLCTSGNTWGTYINAQNATHLGGGSTTNPADSSWIGCCQSRNGTNTSQCLTWYTGSVALNATYKGLSANQSLGNWLPIIAIVAAAVVVIGLLVYYLGGLGDRM